VAEIQGPPEYRTTNAAFSLVFRGSSQEAKAYVNLVLSIHASPYRRYTRCDLNNYVIRILLHDFSEIVNISKMSNPYSMNGLRRKTKQNFPRTCLMKGTTAGRNIYWRMILIKVILGKEFLVEVIQDHVHVFMLNLGVPLPGS
jgi:hypothetical protein